MTLIEFIHSENSKTGKKCGTDDIRRITQKRKEVYKKLKEKTDSPSTKKFYDLLIEELDKIDDQTLEYDRMSSSLNLVRKNKFYNG